MTAQALGFFLVHGDVLIPVTQARAREISSQALGFDLVRGDVSIPVTQPQTQTFSSQVLVSFTPAPKDEEVRAKQMKKLSTHYEKKKAAAKRK